VNTNGDELPACGSTRPAERLGSNRPARSHPWSIANESVVSTAGPPDHGVSVARVV
jgi:hypothetical protein